METLDYKFTSSLSWKIYLAFCLCAFVLFITNDLYAATDAITITLCRVIQWLTGNVATGIGTIGIVVIGAGLFTGKISWTTGIATALGIGIMFGASSLITVVSTGSSACTTS